MALGFSPSTNKDNDEKDINFVNNGKHDDRFKDVSAEALFNGELLRNRSAIEMMVLYIRVLKGYR